jgi:hypothetical protein
MALALRQIALVAARLAPLEQTLVDIFALSPCHRDPAVAAYGLQNVLLPIGRQFVEIVAPTRADTAAGRYLERRDGDGGYMVILQCDDHDARRRHVDALGVRIAHEFKAPGFRNMQLHPRDTGGSFLEIDQQLNDSEDWVPAGEHWRAHMRESRINAIAAAEIQADDAAALAAHWGRILQVPVQKQGDLSLLKLDNAGLCFVPCRDGRPQGLAGLDIVCTDKAAVLGALAAHGIEHDGAQFITGGMRWRLL